MDENCGSEELSKELGRAKRLARAGDGPAAIALADDVIRRSPGEIEGWLVRALVHELDDEYEAAIADMTRAIELNSVEPHLYYNRGRYLFQIDDDATAVGDFSRALSLCDFHKSDYYREELHFWRAETLLRLGRKKEALDDLSHVSDDFSSWTDSLRCKQDLVRECALLSCQGMDGSAAAKLASSR
jgi:tetratricopeptide (TPR) repeat protein